MLRQDAEYMRTRNIPATTMTHRKQVTPVRKSRTVAIFTVKRIHFYEGRYYTYGGFGGFLKETMNHFVHTTLFAHIKTHPPAAGWYELPKDDITYVHLPYYRTSIGEVLCLPVTAFRSLVYLKDVDLVQCRMPDSTGIVGAAIARLFRIPYFCQIIADWDKQASNYRLTGRYGLHLLAKAWLRFYCLLERWACRNSLVFAQGHELYRKYSKISRCHLLYSSSHTDLDMASLPLSNKSPYNLLMVARFTNEKNHRLLINSLNILVQRLPDRPWHLTLVGEGNTRTEIESQVDALGLRNRVVFAGQVKHGKEILKIYDDSGIVILPSRSEGTPKVLMEAMARGTPVVASDVSGIPQMLGHGERGLIFSDNDAEALADAIENIIREPKNALIRANAAHQFASQHSLENSIQEQLVITFREYSV
jgi:glycosyltransferase involved in cell wall biosynthesis